MADKTFNKAFNRVLHEQKRAAQKVEAEQPLTDAQRNAQEAERLRKDETPMTAGDAITRMLLAEKDKDYFRLLQLPAPSIDAAGRPKWDCTNGDISKAYRRLSILVHPDRNPGQDAQNAFEALNRAHRLLRDPGKRDEILAKSLEAAKRRQEKIEAEATTEERQILQATRRVERKQIQEQEAEDFRNKIIRERQEVQERAKRKREMQAKASRRAEEEQLAAADDSEDADEPYVKKSSQLDRRKPKRKFIF